MVKGLFLNRVDIGGTNLVVIERVQRAAHILTDATSAQFAVTNQTSPTAQIAADLFLPVRGVPQDRSLKIRLFRSHRKFPLKSIYLPGLNI